MGKVKDEKMKETRPKEKVKDEEMKNPQRPKRKRQPTIFESLRKITMLEKKVEEIVSRIENPEIQAYANEIKQCVNEMNQFVSRLKMKDMRNYMNLLGLIAVLNLIAEYQLWGQREKSSAFERKYARKLLKWKSSSLKDEKATEIRVKKMVKKFDLKEGVLKQIGIRLSHCPKTENRLSRECIKYRIL